MYYLFTIICSIAVGAFASHYVSRLLDTQHKFTSVRNILFILVNVFLWVLCLLFNGMSVDFLLFALVSSALLSLSYIDIKIYEIPPQYNVFIVLCGLTRLAFDYRKWYLYVIGAFAVSGIFLLLALATKGRGMGGGDIKLMFTCGLLLGWQKILFVMFIGSVLGIIIHGLTMVISKKDRMLSFGPYLSAGVFSMMLVGNQVVSWYVDTFINLKI